jgi:hypothetical protein
VRYPSSLLTSYSWCHRCRRQYRSLSAYHQHVRDSNRHHECPECDFDGEDWDDLFQHLRITGCQIVCEGCNDGDGSYWSTSEYWQHVEEENVCTDCQRHFTSPSHLYQVSRLAPSPHFLTKVNQHELSHREHTFECHMCTGRFKTYSGMVFAQDPL